ncbi:IBR domain protein [Rhizoctonia solani]|nr:IBR domain protein [Rhizoctonia solani]QRW23249.1 IBR domain protein [Rhizoctonia solani]
MWASSDLPHSTVAVATVVNILSATTIATVFDVLSAITVAIATSIAIPIAPAEVENTPFSIGPKSCSCSWLYPCPYSATPKSRPTPTSVSTSAFISFTSVSTPRECNPCEVFEKKDCEIDIAYESPR